MSASLATKAKRLLGDLITIVGESSWVLFAFFFVSLLVFVGIDELFPSLSGFVDTLIGQLIASALIYLLAVGFVIFPLWIRDKKSIPKVLGVDKGPPRSIFWQPFLFWAAYMGATLAAALILSYFSWFDTSQPQELGFKDLTLPVEYIAAFVALVVLPPIAEELLFRGYLFGRLRERFGFWVTTLVVSAVFGLVHLQWNVGIDVAILSVFLCYLRERTGTIWSGMVLHAIKNGLAYFLLFIAPLLSSQVQ